MARTKKVKMAGRFGPRYGLRVRRMIIKIEELQRQKYICKRCGKKAVKRVGTGIWECKACGYKFAGGCYVPSTAVAQSFEKSLER
ncbi:50S ribosomal protein L37Ae [Archaeoglobus sp.]